MKECDAYSMGKPDYPVSQTEACWDCESPLHSQTAALGMSDLQYEYITVLIGGLMKKL